MRPPPEISTVSGYKIRVTECFRHPGEKVAISWRHFPDRQFLLRGRREAADTEHRSQVGHSNYDITANCFLTVVKLAASSHYHAVYF